MLKKSIIRKESSRWLENDIITADQRNRILELYKDESNRKSIVSILSLFGSILLGVGILLFVSANWSALSWVVKLLIIFGILIGTYVSGHLLEKRFPRTSIGIYSLGSLAYGSAIWLIAQVFNYPLQTRMGFFLWFLGLILPFHLLKNHFTGLVSMFAITGWFLTDEPSIAFSFIFLGIISLVFLSFAHFNKSSLFYFLSFFLYIFPLVNIHQRLVDDRFDHHSFIVILAIGILYLSISSYFDKNKILKRSLAAVSILVILFTSYILSFENYFRQPELEEKYLVYILLIAIAGLAGFFRKDSNKYYQYFLAYLTIYSSSLVWLMSIDSEFLILLTNSNLFFQNMVLIVFAYYIKSDNLFNLGIFSFGLTTLIKYFDYFYDLLPKSFFFISMGLLLVVLSILLEKNRKKYLSRMEDNHE